MIVSLDLFLDTLRRSRLLTEESVAAESARFLASTAARKDARGFAEHLCRKRLLSAWQAQNLLAGRHRGFQVGNYTLNRLIGKGGMSFVYLAEHRILKRWCAVKVLPGAKASNPSLLARFQREARAAAGLDHPNVVRVVDAGQMPDGESTVHFLVMDFIDGTTLFDDVKQKGPLPVVRAMDAIRQAARGLQHAHDRGVIHRDIKPENLITDRHGTVRLMDLGLARFAESDEEQLTIQQEGRVLGTANYCAPEQAIDSHRVDSRADIYSLGCTLYFLLSGRPPFHEGSLAQRLLAHQNQPPVPIESLRNDIPPALARLMARMLEKSVDRRIATAAEVADELERIQASLTAPQVPRPVVVESPLAELRDAIGKVASVERAVAMLKSDLSPETSAGRTRASKKNSGVQFLKELRKRRQRQRQVRARQCLGGFLTAFAILVSTLAAWKPAIAGGRQRSLAAASPLPHPEHVVRHTASRSGPEEPVRRTVPLPSEPVPIGKPATRPRTMVASGGDGLRSG